MQPLSSIIKVAKMRAGLQTICTVDINSSASEPQQSWWCHKHSVLFEPDHARQSYSRYLILLSEMVM